MKGAHFESRQIFSTAPTLGELRYFLRVICKELKRYQLWPANCWFFVSLIQEHLSATGDGTFTRGTLPNPSLAQSIRDQIRRELSLVYHMPEPLTVTRLLEYLVHEDRSNNDFKHALTLSLKCDGLHDFSSPRAQKLMQNLQIALLKMCGWENRHRVHFPRLFGAPDILTPDLACSVLCQGVMQIHEANQHNPNDWREDFARSLLVYAGVLTDVHRTGEALMALEESVALCCQLNASDRTLPGKLLIYSLRAYSDCLAREGHIHEALAVREEAVGHARLLYATTLDHRAARLLDDLLDLYAGSLRAIGSTDESHAAFQEPDRLHHCPAGFPLDPLLTSDDLQDIFGRAVG